MSEVCENHGRIRCGECAYIEELKERLAEQELEIERLQSTCYSEEGIEMGAMRELKFRAWDDVAKRMSYSSTEQFDDMLGFRFDHFETDKPIYMQYTGLKDKNGREIYEGDILKYELYFGAVEWIEDWAMFAINYDRLESLILWASVSEIIGNVWGNPDLLKGDENA